MRTTAEIGEALRVQAVFYCDRNPTLYAEAADRLDELEASVEELREIHALMQLDLKEQLTTLWAIDALLPDCPRCGGLKSIQDGQASGCVEAWPECESGNYDPRCCRFPKSCSCIQWAPCPDCTDGKVSIAQLAATWRAVWSDRDRDWNDHRYCEGDCGNLLDHLRSARP